ncbi:hypothetical protein GCM10020001_051770 [Nonomuraea salmonea]
MAPAGCFLGAGLGGLVGEGQGVLAHEEAERGVVQRDDVEEDAGGAGRVAGGAERSKPARRWFMAPTVCS